MTDRRVLFFEGLHHTPLLLPAQFIDFCVATFLFAGHSKTTELGEYCLEDHLFLLVDDVVSLAVPQISITHSTQFSLKYLLADF